MSQKPIITALLRNCQLLEAGLCPLVSHWTIPVFTGVSYFHVDHSIEQQLNFLYSPYLLPADSLPHLVLIRCLRVHPQKGSLPVFRSLVDSPDLLSLPAIINREWSKSAWVKNLTLAAEYSSFLDVCDHLPLSDCLLRLGKPIPHWSVTRGLPKLTRLPYLPAHWL